MECDLQSAPHVYCLFNGGYSRNLANQRVGGRNTEREGRWYTWYNIIYAIPGTWYEITAN